VSDVARFVFLGCFWAMLAGGIALLLASEFARVRRANDELVARRLAQMSDELNPSQPRAAR
jgi:hypothetical protein